MDEVNVKATAHIGVRVSGLKPWAWRGRGYVLVVTLALLVLAVTLLVSVGRVAVVRAAAGREAAEGLQRRWGAVSIRRAVLPYAEPILTGVERQRGEALAVYRTGVRLGGQEFGIVLGDEQAKANVNALLEDADAGRAAVRLRGAMAGMGVGNAMVLRPAAVPMLGEVSASNPAIGGFGQVFDGVPPDKLLGAGGRGGPAELLTCWGNGRINVRRASEAAVRLRADPPLTVVEISRVLSARDASLGGREGIRSGDGGPLRGWLGRVLNGAVSREHLGVGAAVLTDGSACHSLWIVTREGQRERYSLTVVDESDPDKPRTSGFVW